jgi:hypothetical protein
MTEAEVKACRELIATLRFWKPISKEEFLQRYPSAVENGKVATRILEQAYKARNAAELQCALVVGFTFGFAPEHKSILRALLLAKWHDCCDDIVSALNTMRMVEGNAAPSPHGATSSA